MTIRVNIGRETGVLDEWNDHGRREKEEVHGGVKNSLVLGEYGMEVKMHKGCFDNLNRMELSNNFRMTFFE
jgi:hypothetical protein